MADEPKFNIKKVIDEGAQRMTVSDLAQKGFRDIKVLDERVVQDLISRAVDKAVSTQTAGERARLVANSRKELDRLMKERNEFMSKAGMLEAGRNELVQQIEKLQEEIKLRRQIEEQGEAGFQTQLKEIIARQKTLQERVQALQAENAALRQELEQAREEIRRLNGELEKTLADAEAERTRIQEELQAAQARGEERSAAEEEFRRALEEAQAGRAGAERRFEEARKENDALQAQVEGERGKARRSEEEASRLKARLEEEQEAGRKSLEEAKARQAELERRIAQAAAEAARPREAPPPARKPRAAAPAVREPAPPPPKPAEAIPRPPAAPAPQRAAPAAKPPPAAPRPPGIKEGKGLDIGTVYLVAAEEDEKGEVQIRLKRNAFVDIAIDASTKSKLTRLKVPYVVQGNKFYVLGDHAFEMANALGKNTRRPMKDGLISAKESDALPVMKLLIGSILGEPRFADETCFYSVPGDPIDSDLSVVYHKDLFDAVLKALGYRPHHILEGHAVVFAELAQDDFTGIGISCGGGMFNVCVSYKSVPAIAFSTSRGGDWIDNNVATVLGIKPVRAALIKERGIDLMNPKTREEDAISIYYRDLINYTLTNIRERFLAAENMPSFPEPIAIVFSGGTSLAGGFIELARKVLNELEFPIPVREIRHAPDPLNATAKGCLTAAMLEVAQHGA